jgi:lipoate---protein ligase
VTAWDIRGLRGAPSTIHARELPEPLRRTVWLVDAKTPALVLGSTQGDDVVDGRTAAAEGVEVVRRRTGGGAVLVMPGDLVWIDVVLPADDPLWVDDVGTSARWLGEAWVRALDDLGIEGATVHTEPACTTKLSRLICFAGMGPSEVGANGAKVVGIAQRRTRDAARFQTMVHRAWDVDLLGRLLTPGLERHGPGWRDEIERIPVATVVAEPTAIVEAFTARLP